MSAFLPRPVETRLGRTAQQGVAILLVAPAPPPYGGMALQARLLEELLRQDGHSVFLLPSNFHFPRGLRRLEHVPVVRTAMRALLIWRKLWRRVPRADVVHVMAASWLYFFTVVLPAVCLGRLFKKRVILNYRGGAAEAFFAAWGWAARPVLGLATVLTAPSEFLAGHIRKSFALEVSIVPNVLNTSSFPYRRRPVIRPRMLVTRHLEKIYDVESVLKAFSVVRDRYPEACLWIAGTGSEEQALRKQVAQSGLNNVRFLGPVRHSELAAVYEDCDILLNASRVDNFPGALLEASSAGLVVISTNAGGIPHIYQNSRDALLVDVGDWQGLAQSVIRVLQSPGLGLQLAEAGLQLARACEWVQVRRSLYRAYGLAMEFPGATGAGVVRQQNCPSVS